MKIATLAAFVAALALPIGASAQVAPQPAPVQGQQQRSPGQRQYQRWMRRLQGINLSQQQQQAVQGALSNFAAQHPLGSPKDPVAAHALRSQIFSILSPDQQTQLQAQIRALHQQQMERRQMMQQSQAQGQYPQQVPPPQSAAAPPR